MYGRKEINGVVSSAGQGRRLTKKGYQGTFWDGAVIQYLDRHLDYTDVYACQNSHNVYIKFVHFIIYILYKKTKQVVIARTW